MRQVTQSRCEKPVQVTADLKLPLCMEMIKPKTVVHAILRNYIGLGPVCSRHAWNGASANSESDEPAKTFGFTHPRHLQEHYEHAGGKNLYGRAVRSASDLERLVDSRGSIGLLIVGNLLKDSSDLVRLCDERGIDRVFGEFGWFPHYATEHADPLGYAWDSSLCSLRFTRLTATQRKKAIESRERFLARPCGPLPEGVRPPFVLWPLQLLADRVNRYDLDAPDWYDFLLWTRQIVPAKYQLVIKHHPVESPSLGSSTRGTYPIQFCSINPPRCALSCSMPRG